MTNIILVHSALVGPGSLVPTADALRKLGHVVQVPTLPTEPHIDWASWPDALLRDTQPCRAPVVIGHSMGSRVAARLVQPLGAQAFISLDGDIPPSDGPTPPCRDTFLDLLDKLPQENGVLPPWNEWWPTDPLEGIDIDNHERDRLFSEIPKLPRLWFDDAFDMTPWTDAAKGFIALGLWYDDESRIAQSEGWTTLRLKATHMHPATRPDETAKAIQHVLTEMDCT